MAALTAVSARRQGRRYDSRLRRVSITWGLLVFNVLTPGQESLLPIPHRILQLMTQGSLFVALVLAVSVNPRLRMRPNWFLGLYSVLAITSLMTSIRLVGIGTEFRSARLIVFLFVLWLLTPWWGRRDLLILRSHVRVIVLLLGTVVLGLCISPGRALIGWSFGRHHLAYLANGGRSLRGRGCGLDGGALALRPCVPPLCPRGHCARHDRRRAESHTHGPCGHAPEPAGGRSEPAARKATGSQDISRWASSLLWSLELPRHRYWPTGRLVEKMLRDFAP